MQNIENSCAMLEEDKVTKDRQNRRQERDEIQIAEDRCNHLPGQGEGEAGAVACRGRGRSREGERERKFKGIVEKIKRKLDGDLELTQEGRPSLPWSVSKPTCTVPDQHAQREVGVLHGCQVRGREDAGHVVQGQEGEIKIFLGTQKLLITTNIFLFRLRRTGLSCLGT